MFESRSGVSPTGLLLQIAHQRSRRALNHTLHDLGLEARHLGVLAALSTSGPMIHRRLMYLLEMDRSSTTYTVDDLERAGLVERRRHATDRRAFEVHLTDAGRATLERAWRLAREVDERLFGRLGDAKREQLDTLLRELVDGMPKGVEEVRREVRGAREAAR